MTLFIFDLNGTLLYRRHLKDKVSPKPSIRGIKVGSHLVWVRPGVKKMIETKLSEGHHLAVWTSMTEANAMNLIDLVFGDVKSRLMFVWTQEDCLVIPGDTKEKPLMFKPLVRVWFAFPQFNKSNTVLVDDSPQKTVLNPSECFWQVPTFEGDPRDKALAGKVNLIKSHPNPLLEILKRIDELRNKSGHLGEVKNFFEEVEHSEEAKYLAYIFLSMDPSKDLSTLLALAEIFSILLPEPEDVDLLLEEVFELVDSMVWLFPRYLRVMPFLGFVPRGDGYLEEFQMSEGMKKLFIN